MGHNDKFFCFFHLPSLRAEPRSQQSSQVHRLPPSHPKVNQTNPACLSPLGFGRAYSRLRQYLCAQFLRPLKHLEWGDRPQSTLCPHVPPAQQCYSLGGAASAAPTSTRELHSMDAVALWPC